MPASSMDEVESGICALLRGQAKEWDAGMGVTVPRFLAAARYHDVLPLLDAALCRTQVVGVPAVLRDACRGAMRTRAVYELAHRAELIRVFDALAAAGAWLPLLYLRRATTGVAHLFKC